MSLTNSQTKIFFWKLKTDSKMLETTKLHLKFNEICFKQK